MTGEIASSLDTVLAPLDPTARLLRLRAEVGGPLVFTTSLGLEDQVLTHLIAEAGIAVRLVTLDTGRLFPESYALWAATEARYGLRIEPVFPAAADVETMVAQFGIDGFYGSKTARMACCGVRKVDPLDRALRGAAGWLTGLRADQSEARSRVPLVSYDAAHGLIKASPLLDWSRPQTLDFAEREQVPISRLHAEGFASIGCAPCTRAIRPGETERAGRWWWEQAGSQECGLHLGADGRLVRVA